MARVHYWQFLVNEEGQPIENAEVYLYESESTTPAYYYQLVGGGTATRSYPGASSIQTTNEDGFFEFFIGDSSEVNGYETSQKFKISWFKAGVADGFIDNIDIFPATYEVDETDTSIAKNKTVSNYLANKWNDHVDLDYDDSENPHGIAEVNITSSNTDKNRLVSNYLAKSWSEKPDFVVEEITSWSVSGGLYYADVTHNFGNGYPSVQVWRPGTKTMISPNTIKTVDSNNVRIFMGSQVDLKVIVIG